MIVIARSVTIGLGQDADEALSTQGLLGPWRRITVGKIGNFGRVAEEAKCRRESRAQSFTAGTEDDEPSRKKIKKADKPSHGGDQVESWEIPDQKKASLPEAEVERLSDSDLRKLPMYEAVLLDPVRGWKIRESTFHRDYDESSEVFPE
ncbi:g5467 [Coccomyxa elongata]